MNDSRKHLPIFLAITLAFFSGLLAFGNYFFPHSFLRTPALLLMKTVVLLSGALLLLTALQLLRRHMARARQKDMGSLLLVAGFLLFFGAGLLPNGFQSGLGRWLYDWILMPGMAALFALLPIFLAYALFRHLSLRDMGGILLFLGLVFTLLGQIPALAAHFPWLAAWRHGLILAPGATAFRGVIIGLSTGVLLAVFIKLFPRSGFRLAASDEREEERR